jgi:hypothetical protein
MSMTTGWRTKGSFRFKAIRGERNIPVAKIEAISAVYFPKFSDEI